MVIHVVHPDGERRQLQMKSLRELDDFLGEHIRSGAWADMHVLGDDLLVVLGPGPARASDPS